MLPAPEAIGSVCASSASSRALSVWALRRSTSRRANAYGFNSGVAAIHASMVLGSSVSSSGSTNAQAAPNSAASCVISSLMPW